MKEELVLKAYEIAKERYAEKGVDTDKVLEQLQNFHVSMHCWQADDVSGFESAGDLTGGIQATGNYPGKARNMEELQADILKAKSLIPGTHRLNLHEIYGDFGGKFVDRDEVEPKHFQSWIEWGKEHDTKLDFNSTSFSHPKSGNLSLANPDKGIRDFWIEHTKRCRAIAEEMGKAQGDPCIMNLWVHDGCKEQSVNHFLYRLLLKESLDEIFEQKYEKIIPLGGSLVGWFTKFVIIPLFNFFHRYFTNFGIIILLMTLVIKLVVLPFTYKSFSSSAKMNALKPEVEKINAKYPKQEDAMKKQQATMDPWEAVCRRC